MRRYIVENMTFGVKKSIYFVGMDYNLVDLKRVICINIIY